MRRLIFLILSFNCYLVLDSAAQLLVGPVVGGCVSKVYFFEHQFRYKSLPSLGFDGGIMASIQVRKNFRLNAQLLYAQRSKTIVGTNEPRVDNKFRLHAVMHYIELPIFYALEFKNLVGNHTSPSGEQKIYNWFIGAGPVISYWLNDRGTLRSSPLLEVQIDHINYKGAFGSTSNDQVKDANKENIPSPNRFQFGINISGGLAFEPVGFHKIITSIHLNLTQSFFSRKNGTFPASIDDVDVLKSRNHSIRLSIAYLFDTKLEKRKKGKSTIRTREVNRKWIA